MEVVLTEVLALVVVVLAVVVVIIVVVEAVVLAGVVVAIEPLQVMRTELHNVPWPGCELSQYPSSLGWRKSVF